MVRYFLLISIIFISTHGICQNYCIEYSGYGTANNVNGEEAYNYTKNSGDWSNITVRVYMPHTESIKHNSQTITNKIVNPNINYSTYNIEYDQYGNEIHVLTFNANPNYLSYTREYDATVYANIPSGCFSDQFPVNAAFPGDVQQYLGATTNIQSNNASIQALAQSITSGCTKIQEAVQKIAEWVRGNIIYTSTDPQDAVTVLNRRSGNCRGFTNITMALLRSVGIPVRYVSGIILPKSYSLPFRSGGSLSVGGNGPGLHALHEIYYPSEGMWVRGDAQGTVHYTDQNFIKFAHGPDEDNIGGSLSASKSPDFTFTRSENISSTIGSITTNYSYEADHYFSGTYSNNVLLQAHRNCVPTGIFDVVEIVSGPDNFKTGESLYYSANFTSNTGNTYPVGWEWQIYLYHSGGAYLYKSETNGSSSFNAITEPLLPGYNWNIDPIGGIYGEVVVTVALNDGDYKSAVMPVSVEECIGVFISNQTYSSNTTLQGCYVTLDNVSVTSNKLTINAEMGVTIVKDFNVSLGAEFEIQ
ncbi:MAG: transglutaminase-like domain-containing protein [Prolixibacteraceae bacterium]|jgi:hypothetical protein|nr:transglutaminase-like domain-containing protein [Prolixibacteraceae bacterium]